MDSKGYQGFVIPMIIISVCLFAFVIPFVFSMGIDDSHDDIVLQPRHTPTATPLDRILTQQAFANLFFTPTEMLLIQADSSVPTSTESFAGIPITGSTATNSPTASISPSPTKTSPPIAQSPTESGGNNPPTSTSTQSPPPTNTAVVVVRFTNTPEEQEPPTETPVPEPTDPPPTDPPPTDPPPTDPPPEPTPGGNGTNTGGLGLFDLILWLLAPFAAILPKRLV